MVPISPMKAASTVPAKPNQTCAFTLEVLADPSTSAPTCSFAVVQSCKAVPSSAQETNSNHIPTEAKAIVERTLAVTHSKAVTLTPAPPPQGAHYQKAHKKHHHRCPYRCDETYVLEPPKAKHLAISNPCVNAEKRCSYH